MFFAGNAGTIITVCKKNMWRILALMVVMTSCNENGKKVNKASQDEVDTTEVNVDLSSMLGTTECYWRIAGRDTMVLILLRTGNEVSGKLSFDNYQIDGSAGSVAGEVEDDIVRLWYTYQSEGTNSTMEIWLKKQEDALIRGMGPSATKGDSVYFTSHDAIRYSGEQVLRKTSCDSIPGKYK